jgi:hypothetical protein
MSDPRVEELARVVWEAANPLSERRTRLPAATYRTARAALEWMDRQRPAAGPWQTGKPTEVGEYLVEWEEDDGIYRCYLRWWDRDWLFDDRGVRITRWAKINRGEA